MKRILLLCIVIVLVFTLCACNNEKDTGSNIYDTYTDSLMGFVGDESGGSATDPSAYLYGEYQKDGVIYNLIYSKTQTSKKDVFYLVRTMEVEKKFITDKISEDADISEELSPQNPYSTAMMQNHAGDIFFVVVKVLNKKYSVTYNGKTCPSPHKNVYVQTAETEPELEIVKPAVKGQQ